VCSSDLPDGPIAPPGLSLELPRPNPSSQRVAIRWSAPRAERITVEILDPSGRRLRLLREGAGEGGTSETAWNGRDDANHRCGSGLYFVRVTAGRDGGVEESVTRRLLRVR
jgi:flagellar hook assembly protein FlgD